MKKLRSVQSVLILAAAAVMAVACAKSEAAPNYHTVQPQVREEIRVATGSNGKNYFKSIQELGQECNGSGVKLIPITSGGSLDNIDKLTNNEVNGALVQFDVLAQRYRQDPDSISKYKTALALFPEVLHFISVPKTGPIWKKVNMRSVLDLQGKKLGVQGGAEVSARIFKADSGINYEVISFGSDKDMFNALAKGDIDGVLTVGAYKLPTVATLSKDYVMLTVPESILSKVSKVYSSKRVTYSNLTNSEGVVTVSTDAVFIVKPFSTPEKMRALASLRQCYKDAIPRLKDTTGKLPAWEQVNVDNKGKWFWLE